MKKAMLKDMIMEVKNTRKRYLSILLIILLGAGFFSGIKVVSLDMKVALDKYYEDSNFMDYRTISTLGFSVDNVDKLSQNKEIDKIMPTISTDVIVRENDAEEVVNLMTLPFIDSKYDYLNKLEVVDGRLPNNSEECVMEASILKSLNLNIGDKIKLDITSLNEEMKDKVPSEFVIVGTVNSPLYMSIERGNTNIGNGKISGILYVDNSAIDSGIYTQVYFTLKGSKDLKCYSKAYEEYIKEKKNDLDGVIKELEIDRYNQIKTDAVKKISEAQEELDNAKETANKEFKNAKSEIENAKAKLNDSKKVLYENEIKVGNEFSSAKKEIENAYISLENGRKEYEEKRKEAIEYINILNNNVKEADDNLNIINDGILQCNLNINELNNNILTLNNSIKELKERLDLVITDEEKEEINLEISTLSEEIELLNIAKSQLEQQLVELESNKSQIELGIKYANLKIEEINNSIQDGLNQLESNKLTLSDKSKEFEQYKNNVYSEIALAKAQIENAENEISINEVKLSKEIEKTNKELEDAQSKIDNNSLKIEEIEKPDIYLLDRDTVYSNVSYFQDADRIDAVAKVFPLIFFIVAALVSLTSMTRMVEEQRGQIGLLKALGYTKMQIASKYLWYAISASLIGSIVGILIGFNLLPRIIFNIYGMLYNMPQVVIEYSLKYIIIGIFLSVLCTGGATLFACINELREVPASLMRPKAPKSGKRVLMERIPFIWNKLNFTQKVTCRNILRYKKRFFMTIIGIGGCTGLVLVGFGLKDSILSIVPNQYENVYNYDMQISYKDKVLLEEKERLENTLKERDEITSFTSINQSSINVINDNVSKDANIIIVEDTSNLKEYINFNDRITKEEYDLDSDGVIITEKLAKLLNVNVGDNITLNNNNEKRVEVKVSNITEHYIMHYIYITKELYTKLYNESIEPNMVIAKINYLDETTKEKFRTELLKNDIIASVDYIRDTGDKFAESMKSLDSVTLILIISAGLLAFVVLYNLSNINISERIRELATIKVLGFYDLEVSSYVYRENIILTLLGTLLGLVIGYFLNSYIITTCEVDLVMFGRHINFISYIYSIAITIGFAVIVNIITHFSLKKIDMIEALKSVE